MATGTAVHQFLERQDDNGGGTRLEDRVEQILEKSVLQSYRLGCRDSVLYIQRLRAVKNASKLTNGIFSILKCHMKGGFVFAKDT